MTGGCRADVRQQNAGTRLQMREGSRLHQAVWEIHVEVSRMGYKELAITIRS